MSGNGMTLQPPPPGVYAEDEVTERDKVARMDTPKVISDDNRTASTASGDPRVVLEPTPNDMFGLLRSYSRHRDFVRLALLHIIQDIERRSLTHDASKMADDEFFGFARLNSVARIHKFGSLEYTESMKGERATIDVHFSRNSHHPERPTLLGERAESERGLPDDCTYWAARDEARMTFLDVIEMVCDWWGARKGYGDRRTWQELVELNFNSKGHLLSQGQLWLAREVAAFLWTLEK